MIDFTDRLIKSVYRRVFGEEMTGEGKSFLRKLSWVSIGYGIATLISIGFNIIAQGLLGPDEYGKFALIQSTAMFLFIPMLLGLHTAIVKYTSENEDSPESQRKIISTGYILILALIISTVLVCILFAPQLRSVFDMNARMFYISILFAVLYVLFTIHNDTLRGLDKMAVYAFFQPVFAASMLISFLFLIRSGSYDIVTDKGKFIGFDAGIFANLIAYGIAVTLILVFFVSKYLRPKVDVGWANTLMRYSAFTLIGQLSFVCYTNIDKQLINQFMSTEDLGIYRAYWNGSLQVASVFIIMFIAVYFPTLSKRRDQSEVFAKISKGIPYLFVIGLPALMLTQFASLKVSNLIQQGEAQYPINPILLLLFALASMMIVWDNLLAWTFNSEGVRGAKLTIIGTVTVAIIDVSLNFLLIPHFGARGAVLAMTVAFTVGVVIRSSLKGRLRHTTKVTEE